MREPPQIELTISMEQLCFIIVKAHELFAKSAAVGLEPGSNPSDDRSVGILEDQRRDPIAVELGRFITALDEDRQIDLVALFWVGRGDYTVENWPAARAAAAARHTPHTAAYLMGTPQLADFLEDALSDLDRSCEDEEMGRL